MPLESTAIDLGTFAIIISILVGIAAIYGAIKTAKSEAKKAADLLTEMRTQTLESLKKEFYELKHKADIDAIRIDDRLKVVERSVSRLEQFSWGRDAKSEPAFLRGEKETQEHDRRPDQGIFKDD